MGHRLGFTISEKPKFEGSKFLNSFLIHGLLILKVLYVYGMLYPTILLRWMKLYINVSFTDTERETFIDTFGVNFDS